ncbi:alpha/beta hydrolase [Roseibacillus ishigakijimensis]|uniref:Alpha/beta fold hydrolase n=1 Tax=Roseibacillus ishigakijimensis TaxID=454146 RepID=A0A934VMW7_9BACT|nr:alpha/beta fold hydrolase [Roseibacillus ishigakijimensis]MBK1834526.1 alpha/beta fold hydrolase [Roseibacillus ishigakijimensis]
MRALIVALPLLLLSCALSPPEKDLPPPTSYLTTSDGKALSLQHWNRQARPETVLLALHGIEGAARDFGNLGRALPEQAPRTTLYALNQRGAGYDADWAHQGDIANRQLWQRDLRELHTALRQRHPDARLVWVGESMGSLVMLQALAEGVPEAPEGLVLVSPVVSLGALPRWQVALLRVAATLAPGARVSLAALAGGSFQATTHSDHFAQSEGNPYHVESYTLRYLATLAHLAEEAPRHAREVPGPTLILHGGQDFLTSTGDMERFRAAFPQRPDYQLFPQSHHLLFYDKERKDVIAKLLLWLLTIR